MKSKNLAALAFAILGIFTLGSSVSILQGLLTIPFFAQEFEGKIAGLVLAYLFPFVLMVTAGVYLIVKRYRLAAWVVFDAQDGESEQSCTELPDLAFAILGLYLVVSTLPSLGSLAGQLINLRAMESFQDFMPAFRANVGQYLGTLAKLLIGGYLFLYARDVASWWRRRGPKQSAEACATIHTCAHCSSAFDPDDYREGQERRCSVCKAEIPNAVVK